MYTYTPPFLSSPCRLMSSLPGNRKISTSVYILCFCMYTSMLVYIVIPLILFYVCYVHCHYYVCTLSLLWYSWLMLTLCTVYVYFLSQCLQLYSLILWLSSPSGNLIIPFQRSCFLYIFQVCSVSSMLHNVHNTVSLQVRNSIKS